MDITKVLLIEDSREIIQAIELSLSIRWPEAKIVSAETGQSGITMTERERPDIVLLDLGLPDISGFDVLKQIRTFSKVPVMILTVRFEENNIVRALEEGADDYMTKPFKQLEFLARVKALVRRNAPQTSETIRVGPIRFEPDNLTLFKENERINLTRTEGIIMSHLMRNAGTISTYASLAEAIWGVNYPDANNGLKVHIRRLREKLEKDTSDPVFILTKPNVGYYMPKLL